MVYFLESYDEVIVGMLMNYNSFETLS